MDAYQKTRQLLHESKLPPERIAADTNLSMATIYKMKRGVASPTYSNLCRVYEYLSGRKLEV